MCVYVVFGVWGVGSIHIDMEIWGMDMNMGIVSILNRGIDMGKTTQGKNLTLFQTPKPNSNQTKPTTKHEIKEKEKEKNQPERKELTINP